MRRGLPFVVFLAVAPTWLFAGQPIDVGCSPSTPVVTLSQTIRVRAWAPATPEPLSFRWAATTGRIGATGPDVDWAPEASAAITVEQTPIRSISGVNFSVRQKFRAPT